MAQLIILDMRESLFAGDGEMSTLMRSLDWSQTPLGPVEQWPQSLCTTVSILLNSRYPMFTFWGTQLVKLYNDAYRPILGSTKHPQALGCPAPEIWPDIWDAIGPLVEQVITKGESTWYDNFQLFMRRSGYLEETYFTFSYSPIRDETGGIGGLFCACTETTKQVLGDRRLRTLRDLAAQAGKAKTVDAACDAVNTLANNAADIPFALLYLLDAEGKQAKLIGTTGLEENTPASPNLINLAQLAKSPWPLAEVVHTACIAQVTDVIERFGELQVGPWEESPHTALILPVASPGQERPTALLVAGISSRRALDDDYQGFLQLVAGQLGSAIANARAYEAEKMAEICKKAAVQEQTLRLQAEKAQQEAEAIAARLSHILESMSDAFLALDKDWRIVYQNAAGERINNKKPRSQVLGKTHWEEWPASVDSILEHQYRYAMAQQIPVQFEYHYYLPPDYDVWVEIHAYPSTQGLGIFYRDISDAHRQATQRKRAEAELKKSHEQLEIRVAERTSELIQLNTHLQQSESTLRSFFNSSSMMMGIVELHDHDILHISDNQASADFFGTTSDAMQNEFASDLGVPQQRIEQWTSYYRQAEQIQAPVQFEDFIQIATSQRCLSVSVCPIAVSSSGYSRFSYIVEDITERKQAQEQIEASLREKEVLLKEIHHRVKNNLGIVSSLLQMQCRRTQDSQATTILRDSQNRIASIALVHEKLYRSQDLANINFSQYIPDLTTHLFDSYNVSSDLIKLNLQIQDVSLDIESAIPYGLIINELVSNALKYAFPDKRTGEILVNIYQDTQNLTLIIRDNGVGLPTDFDSKKTKTLGITLIQGLVKQLKGKIEINSQPGTEFKITLQQGKI